jgi:hypothetical protein
MGSVPLCICSLEHNFLAISHSHDFISNLMLFVTFCIIMNWKWRRNEPGYQGIFTHCFLFHCISFTRLQGFQLLLSLAMKVSEYR